MSGANPEDVRLVHGSLNGDPGACETLVRRITPIVQHRVSRVMAHFRSRPGRPLERGDMLDLTQQLLLLLFENAGAILSAWDPARGLSLDNFVGLVAEREARAILRSGRRSAWAETPTRDDLVDAYGHDPGVEHLVSVRDQISQIWSRLEAELSPRGLELFRALLIDEMPVADVRAMFELSETAVYNFRSRIRRRVRQIREHLEAPNCKDAASDPAVAVASASSGSGR
jgi:RNA polymerase sigma-70 factor (ECF subfamily)